MPDLDASQAEEVIEQLRLGVPPDRFVSSYSVGYDGLLDRIVQRHLNSTATRGRIRFVSGSWGRGKTHFLSLLRERAFDAGFLVSTYELTQDESPFNKFEQVFYGIIRGIAAPAMYREGDRDGFLFGKVLRRSLMDGERSGESREERFERMKQELFADDSIDIDFRRMVTAYWETFVDDDPDDESAVQDRRGKILQWFGGEGTIGDFRSAFGVQKLISRANSRAMLQSLSRLCVRLGYRGLVILLDEAPAYYSSMRRSNVKQAHNNLLALINGIDDSEGLVLIYAATPDFFIDDQYGVASYGALAQRVGRPEERPPRALDRIWNIDAIELTPKDYEEAALKIRSLFGQAYEVDPDNLISQADLRDRVRIMVDQHPQFAGVAPWRVIVKASVDDLTDVLEGAPLPDPVEKHFQVLDQFQPD